MPIVQVNLVEGRPPEKIAAMIRGISQAVADSLDAPIESVRVIVNEMAEHQYGVGGKPWPEVVEERRRAAEATTDAGDDRRTDEDPTSERPTSERPTSERQGAPS